MALLNAEQQHRAAGVLVTAAAGDALGAGYEFSLPYPDNMQVHMKGGGRFEWEPGQWTDDTEMGLVIANVALGGADLRQAATLNNIAYAWYEWAYLATDVGIQTTEVLRNAAQHFPLTAARMLEASAELHERTGLTAGNGSFARTAPIALIYLDDAAALTEAAATISRLTHYDNDATEACILWCHLIRHAVLDGTLDPQQGCDALPADRAAVWRERLDAAAKMTPADFTKNSWVVETLQAAWCSIVTTGNPDLGDPDHARRALEAAVRGGRDTDTVAAVAGALLGGLYGPDAVPHEWLQMLHGWPELTGSDLISAADRLANLT